MGYEINTTLKIKSWNDWVDLLKFFDSEGIMSMETMMEKGFLIDPYANQDFDVDTEPDQWPEISEDILDKKCLSLGTFYFYMEESFDRFGKTGASIIQRIDDEPNIPSEWIAKCKDHSNPEYKTFFTF